VTAKADLWSTGVILYEALFGQAPFSSDTLEQLVGKIKEDTPVPIPRSNKLSRECRDLLSGCLIRSPEKRIDFSDFFQHPFLDLQHMPCQASLLKATQLVTRAVVSDKEGHKDEALSLYKEAVQYFLPLVAEEQWAGLRSRVGGYVRRVKQLSGNAEGPLEKLLTMFKDSKLEGGIELCLAGEEYDMEGRYQLALDNLTQGLGVLVPGLSKEPKSGRKELLGKFVVGWMEKAEKVKQKVEGELTVTIVQAEKQETSCSVQ